MGIKKSWFRGTLIGATINTVKNIYDEYSVVDGVKKSIKEYYCEDNPITSQIYEAGKSDGKAEGYEDASNEYYEKLLKQANKFDKEVNNFNNNIEKYKELLDEYEKAINKLEKKLNRTELENKYLRMLLLKERELRNKIG